MNEIRITIPKNLAVDEASDLRENIYELISNGEKNFILNFSNCAFIDSTGLGVLVSIYKKCLEISGQFKLYSIQPDVMRVFKLTRLDSVFTIV